MNSGSTGEWELHREITHDRRVPGSVSDVIWSRTRFTNWSSWTPQTSYISISITSSRHYDKHVNWSWELLSAKKYGMFHLPVKTRRLQDTYVVDKCNFNTNWINAYPFHSVVRWRSGRVLDLQSIVRGFKSQPLCCQVQPWASCKHTCASVTEQYNLVPANGRWSLAAGKVTVGLASHWPCVTDNSGITTYGLMALRDEHPA